MRAALRTTAGALRQRRIFRVANGWLDALLTHPVQGLENYNEMIRLLTEEKNAIKVYVEVSKI